MKVGIDVSQIVYGQTGVSTYTKNLVENLIKIDKDDEFVLYAGSLKKEAADIKYLSPDEKFFRFLRHYLTSYGIGCIYCQ